MDYYKNEPTVQEFKTVFDYLSKKWKMAIDHDAMPTPAPIPQLRARDSDTSEHLEGEDDIYQLHTPERDSGTSDHLEGEDKSEHLENAEMQGEGSENLENVHRDNAPSRMQAPLRSSSRLQLSYP